MKKLLLILVLCLSTIGLAGCGSSAPTKVTLDPKNGKCQKLEVGKDIDEGNYNIESNGEVWYVIATQGSSIYDANNNYCKGGSPAGPGGLANPMNNKTISLSKGEYLFINVGNDDVKLSKN